MPEKLKALEEQKLRTIKKEKKKGMKYGSN